MSEIPTETIPPAAHAEAVAATGRAAHALAAGVTGLASAHAAGAELVVTYALASLVFAVSAFAGCDRLSRHFAGKFEGIALPALAALGLPIVFLLLIAVGSDAVMRGHAAWHPVLAALPSAVLFGCLSIALQFAQRDVDIAAGRRSLATRLAPAQAKLWFAACMFPGLIWLVFQVGQDALPQAAAAGVLGLLLLLKAAQTLAEYGRDETDELLPVVRLAALAGPLCGFIIAAALAFDTRWTLS